MNLLSTSFWSALATLLRLGSSLVVAKLVATTGGPTALAVFGQFMSFLVLITGVSGALIQSGVVKYAAEYRDSHDQLAGMLASAIKLSGSIALLGAFSLILFYQEVSNFILHQPGWSSLFLVTGIVLPLFVINSIALALLNGMGKTRQYLLLNAMTAFVNMLAVVVLSMLAGVEGALYGLLFGPMLACIVSAGYVFKYYGKLFSVAIRGDVQLEWVRRLFQFAAMALISMFTYALIPMAIRDELAKQVGWQEAGYWQAVWQVSGAYLGVITSGFTVYYLPKLSQLKNDEDIRLEMLCFYRTVMPFVLLMGGMVYLLREPVLLMLYSEKFLPSSPLFGWQVAGDMLKILSWVLSYMLIAKKMTAWFIGTELIFVLLTYVSNVILIPVIGIKAPVVVYAGMYALYAVFMYLLIGRRYLYKRTVGFS